jgi:hypothetical protein
LLNRYPKVTETIVDQETNCGTKVKEKLSEDSIYKIKKFAKNYVHTKVKKKKKGKKEEQPDKPTPAQ